jgi:hypothetical protein
LLTLVSTTVILASWARAIEIFNTKLTHDERKRIDPARCPRASFNDFLTALSTARSKAETGHSRCKQNIIKLCQVVNRYAVVGDLIMQHHAEYTSLAWGAFRFLLLVSHCSAKQSRCREHFPLTKIAVCY